MLVVRSCRPENFNHHFCCRESNSVWLHAANPLPRRKNKWFIYLSLNIIFIDAGNCQRLFVCGMNACVVFEILERDQQKLDSKWHVNDFSGLKNTNVHDQSVLGGVSCGVGIRLGAYVASQSNSCLWRGLIKRRFRFYYFVSSFPKAMF